jgi:hypothetical protein
MLQAWRVIKEYAEQSRTQRIAESQLYLTPFVGIQCNDLESVRAFTQVHSRGLYATGGWIWRRSCRAFEARGARALHHRMRGGRIQLQALLEPSCCQLYPLWTPSLSWGGALDGCIQGRALRGEEAKFCRKPGHG